MLRPIQPTLPPPMAEIQPLGIVDEKFDYF